MKWGQKHSGFTLVELLIVIVVIAILAAVTIMAYNGITSRSKVSSALSTLSQISRKIEAAKVSSDADQYPISLAASGIEIPDGVSYSITATGKGYCATYSVNNVTYYVTQASGGPVQGDCVTVDGLVGWWPLNADISDWSGNSASGTPNAIVSTEGVDGRDRGAYTFNGSSSYINLAPSSALNINASFTISAWIKPSSAYTATSGWQHIFAGSSSDIGFGLSASTSGIFPRITKISNSDGPAATSPVQKGQWSHVVVTVTNGAVTYYLNGQAVNSGTYSPGYAPSAIKRLGSGYNTYASYFMGDLDDIRVYSRALSASEASRLYGAGAL